MGPLPRRYGAPQELSPYLMRAVFAFPPIASPTYVPLGLATLAAHVRLTAPGCQLRLADLNLASWIWLAERQPAGQALMRFCRGQAGDFFNPAQYAAHLPAWQALRQQLDQLGAALLGYVERGRLTELAEDAAALLAWQAEQTLQQDPELVGLSLPFPEQLPFALALARRIKELCGPRAPTLVIGGAALSAVDLAELLAACPYLDGVCAGEGEAAAASLCLGRPLRAIPTLWRRDGQRLLAPDDLRVLPAAALPPADFGDLPLPAYFNPQPVLPAVYSRGCRWRRCRFCAHNASFGGYRAKAAASFADELAALQARFGCRHVYLADQYLPAAALAELGQTLEQRGLQLAFHAMGRPTADWTAERLEQAARGGCCWISWGVESGSPRLLRLAGKGTRVPTIERVVQQCHEAGISNLLMMIFGLPTSTELDLEQTFALLERLYPQIDAMTASAFVLFQETPFAAIPEHFGLQVSGRQLLLQAAGLQVHGTRLHFAERSQAGEPRPPRGALEVAAWEQRARWLPELPLGGLCSEHYLLYADHQAASRRRPIVPFPRAA